MKKILMSVLTVGLMVSNLNAGTCQNKTCNHVKITNLVIGSYHALIDTTSGLSNLNCTPKYGYIQLKKSNPSFKEIYATLLAAQSAESEVTIVVYANAADNNSCVLSYMYKHQ